MCCQIPRKGREKEHLASSFHCFSSRSTQKQRPDAFTFGPTQSDPKYPRNNGLQERSRVPAKGVKTPGSSRGDNTAKAALNHKEGVGSPFSSHQLLQDTPWLTPGSSSGISKPRARQMPHGSLVNTTGAWQSPGIPSPFGEIFLWVVAPFICKHVWKSVNDLDYPWSC